MAVKMFKNLKHTLLWFVPLLIILLLIPLLIPLYLKSREPDYTQEFPLSVDPEKELIFEDEAIVEYLEKENIFQPALSLTSIASLEDMLRNAVASFGIFLDERNLSLASAEKIIKVPSGIRKEEVANLFARPLGWSAQDKKDFLAASATNPEALKEGMFIEGIYIVAKGTTPSQVQQMILDRFNENVVARYSTSTAEKIPLETALTLASLIERETIGTADMRVISGIIWNRIFKDMKLQLDATLQYSKANQAKNGIWWPKVNPQDKYIRSPYNTYQHPGLPPHPIASPSVAAIIAALNPKKTDCYFYFHDKKGDFYCAPTYEDHVALLKKTFGRGR